MDSETLIKLLAVFGVSGLCTLVVYCATALPGLASEDHPNKMRAYLIVTVMVAFIVLSFLGIFFLVKYKPE